jgi:hypothetical protein
MDRFLVGVQNDGGPAYFSERIVTGDSMTPHIISQHRTSSSITIGGGSGDMIRRRGSTEMPLEAEEAGELKYTRLVGLRCNLAEL